MSKSRKTSKFIIGHPLYKHHKRNNFNRLDGSFTKLVLGTSIQFNFGSLLLFITELNNTAEAKEYGKIIAEDCKFINFQEFHEIISSLTKAFELEYDIEDVIISSFHIGERK